MTVRECAQELRCSRNKRFSCPSLVDLAHFPIAHFGFLIYLGHRLESPLWQLPLVMIFRRLKIIWESTVRANLMLRVFTVFLGNGFIAACEIGRDLSRRYRLQVLNVILLPLTQMKNYEDLNWIGHMVIRKETDKSLSLLMKSQEETPKELVGPVVSFRCLY